MFALALAAAILCAGAAFAFQSATATLSPPTSLSVNGSATYTATAAGNSNDILQSVVFTFPRNTDLSAATMVLTQGANTWNPVVTRTATTLTGTITQPLARATLTATVANVRNPSQPGAYTYSAVFTSNRGQATGTSAPYSLAANTSAPSVATVVPATSTVSLPSAYTVPFTVGPQGRLESSATAGANQVYVDFPAGFTLPASPSAASVTLNGQVLTSAPSVSGNRVTLTVPSTVSIPGGGSGAIVFSNAFGILNPPTPGSYSIKVSTSAETGQGTSPSLAITPAPDTTPPVTMLLASPAAPDGLSGWYVSPVYLTLASNEPGQTYYRWDTALDSLYLVPFWALEGSHTLSFHSVDSSLNVEAEKSAGFSVDLTDPPAPSLIAGSVTTSTADLSWPSVSDGQSGISYYEVRRNGSVVATTSSPGYSATGLTPSTTYEFSVRSFDVAGRFSAPSTVNVTTDAGDTTAPTTSLSTNITPSTSGWYVDPLTITLTADEPGSTFFHWDSGSDSPYAGSIAASEGTHTLWYHSVDTVGNAETEKSMVFRVDLTAPAAPAVSAGVVTSNTAGISWGAVSDGHSGLDYYEVYRDGSKIATTAAATFTANGLAPETAYEFAVKAVDVAGWASPASTPLTVTTLRADTTPPTTSVAPTPASPDGDSGWYRSAPSIELQSNEPGTTYFAWDNDPEAAYSSPLTAAEGVHVLHYRSTDVAGNAESQQAATFRVDTVAPDPPTLTANLSGQSAIQLDWTAVTDSTSGMRDYRIVDTATGAVVATTASTSATISGLGAGVTKTYTVTAVDVAGNAGLPSNHASATTPSAAPYSVTDPATGVRVDFFSATDHGALTVTKKAADHAAPANFDLLGDLYFDLTATTVYTGDFLVTIPYNPAMLAPGVDEANLRIFHYANGAWHDVTVGMDTEANTVTGKASSFSPFAVYAPSASGPAVETPASAPWSLLLFAFVGLGAVGWRLRRA